MPIVGIERAFNDPAVGLRCIDHCPLAAAYCNVTVINDYISAFDVVDIVVALIAGAAAPHVTRHVALRNACCSSADFAAASFFIIFPERYSSAVTKQLFSGS